MELVKDSVEGAAYHLCISYFLWRCASLDLQPPHLKKEHDTATFWSSRSLEMQSSYTCIYTLFIYLFIGEGVLVDDLRELFIPTPIPSKLKRWVCVSPILNLTKQKSEVTYKVGRLVGFFKQWWPIHHMGSRFPLSLLACLLSFGKNQYIHRDDLKSCTNGPLKLTGQSSRVWETYRPI